MVTAAAATAENIKQGEDLDYLAGLLFFRAATEWHWGVGLELTTGVMMVLISELHLPHVPKLLLALVGLILFGVAYYLRFASEDTFDLAETMHRQSTFSEGLGWPVNGYQFTEWKSRAGKKILTQLKNTPQHRRYWSSDSPPGPRRLLELTIQSSFWTRKLYKKLRTLLWWAFFIIIGLGLMMISASLLSTLPSAEQTSVASAVFLLLPALLVFDLLDWILKLNRLIEGIKEVEMDMERLLDQAELPEPQVMRLVSEYNATVSSGLPIHPRFYTRWHDEIKELWKMRAKQYTR